MNKQVKFDRLPGSRKLFLDFLSGASRNYYHYHFTDSDSVVETNKRLTERHFHRQEVVETLLELNKSYGAGAKTIENINKLLLPETTAVFTGQQVSLFGGPLYTFYKAALAIKLAETNSKALSSEVVPIFWMAADDADFAEVEPITLLSTEDVLQTLVYQPERDISNQPMSLIKLDSNINLLINDYEKSLPQTEFRNDLVFHLREYYQPGESIVTAFGKYLSYIFRDKGLILVDPSHPTFRKLAKSVFQKELQLCRQSAQLVAESNSQLEQAGYHLQVTRPQHYSNLFYYDGKRSRIDIVTDGFEINGSFYSQAEMEDMLQRDPTLFSPNVFLRSIVQSHIFPTLIQVVGPAEIAYFCQIRDLFDLFDEQPPVVYPRYSATVIEKKTARILEKHDLNFIDFSSSLQSLITLVNRRSFPDDLSQEFQSAMDEVTDRLKRLIDSLDQNDEGLITTAGKSLGRIDMEIKNLRKKTFQAHKKKNQVIAAQLEQAANHLFPAGNLQERVFGLNYYATKYGVKIVDYLYDCVDSNTTVHHLVYLDEV